MRVGIVGSREFQRLDMVKDLVLTLEKGDVVVSGGARGTDRTAAEYGRFLKLEVDEKLPQHEPSAPRHVVIGALFARNTLIAEGCDELHAFINHGQRSNGTFDTIFKAARMGRAIMIHYSNGDLRDFNFPAPPTKRRVEQLVYYWEGETHAAATQVSDFDALSAEAAAADVPGRE